METDRRSRSSKEKARRGLSWVLVWKLKIGHRRDAKHTFQFAAAKELAWTPVIPRLVPDITAVRLISRKLIPLGSVCSVEKGPTISWKIITADPDGQRRGFSEFAEIQHNKMCICVPCRLRETGQCQGSSWSNIELPNETWVLANLSFWLYRCTFRRTKVKIALSLSGILQRSNAACIESFWAFYHALLMLPVSASRRGDYVMCGNCVASKPQAAPVPPDAMMLTCRQSGKFGIFSLPLAGIFTLSKL